MNSPSSTLASKTTWIIFGALLAAVAVPALIYISYLSRDLPKLSQLEDYRPKLVSKVYSADGKVIKEFFEERRSYVPLDSIPSHIKDALLATEDRNFYHHWGFNPIRFAQAILIDIIHMEKRQGASTLTQQLSRVLYFTTEKTLTRKIRELLTAIQIERTYTKDEILEMYLNQVYLGHGTHGVQMAAQKYFGKNVERLLPHEGATLVAIVQRPETLTPFRNPAACSTRRNLVLANAYLTGRMSRLDFEIYKKLPLSVIDGAANEHYGVAPYFTEYVRQILWKEKQYGDRILTDGMQIQTTLDTRAQRLAEKYVNQQLQEMQRRSNKHLVAEREHLKVFNQTLLDSLGKTLREVMADSALFYGMLNKRRPVQAALITIENRTGHIIAMVGGRDFEENKFNRAVQAQRQPGSAFKPFVYTTVIDNGYPPTYEVPNQPVVVEQVDGTVWRPHNYDNSISGPVTLRRALALSLNLPTVRLVQGITNPATVVRYARDMGLTTNIPPYDAIALGAGEVIPLEITSAFTAFPNQGVRMEPIAILSVIDKDGNVLENNQSNGKEVFSKETAYVMTDMLRSVIEFGTGASARSKHQFYRPAGGKTGTTNEFRDAWFIGFTAQLTTGVWMGFDQQDQSFEKGGTGAEVALPIWAPYMKAVHDSLGLPVEEFPNTGKIVRLELCSTTKRLANDECPNVYYDIFKLGSEPNSRCSLHSGRQRERRRERS